MTQRVISLASIPPRFPLLTETLIPLVTQQADMAMVNICIPKRHRRFDFSEANASTFIPSVNVRLVDTDHGPAMKVLPAAHKFCGQDVRILFCDDDKVYDPNWVQRFSDCGDQYPDCWIVEEGGDVDGYSKHRFRRKPQPRSGRITKDLSYRLKRALSLGIREPRKNVSSGYVDILEGWSGVLVRSEFFSDAAIDIPEILWIVDDIWLSGGLSANGEDPIRNSSNSNEFKQPALRRLVREGYGRTEAIQTCVDYFRNTHGIWGEK